jgi:hypothetical protein
VLSGAQVVTAPAEVASAISVEAYKRYVCVSIMVHGKVLEVPRVCGVRVSARHYRLQTLTHHIKTFRDAAAAYTVILVCGDL